MQFDERHEARDRVRRRCVRRHRWRESRAPHQGSRTTPPYNPKRPSRKPNAGAPARRPRAPSLAALRPARRGGLVAGADQTTPAQPDRRRLPDTALPTAASAARTRRALAEFQREYHLTGTGALDRATAEALLGRDAIGSYAVPAASPGAAIATNRAIQTPEKKRAPVKRLGPLRKTPAASYSPTRTTVQYHRPWRA